MTDSPEPTRLNTHIAVELLPRMTPTQVAEAVIRGGKTVGTWFRRLEENGLIEVAMRKFVRFRTDLEDPMPLLRHLLDRGHGVVYATKDGFEMQFPPRKGRVSSLQMLGGFESPTKTYKGPKIKGWEAAFGGG